MIGEGIGFPSILEGEGVWQVPKYAPQVLSTLPFMISGGILYIPIDPFRPEALSFQNSLLAPCTPG